MSFVKLAHIAISEAAQSISSKPKINQSNPSKPTFSQLRGQARLAQQPKGNHKTSDDRESFGTTAGACDLIHLANGAAMFAKFFFRAESPAVLLLGFLNLVPSQLSAEPPRTITRAEYLPVQAIDYNIGSKSIGGYYVQTNGTCSLILMITEKIDLDRSAPLSAARVRLVLRPGAVAGLDSAEGYSLNFTCDLAAAKLLVDEGETSVLIAQQKTRLYN